LQDPGEDLSDNAGSLDDAEALLDEDEISTGSETDVFTTLMNGVKEELALAHMLKLSTTERMLWAFGKQLSRTEMATRIFIFLDHNKSGSITIGTLEALLRVLQDVLPFTKRSFAFIEVRRQATSCLYASRNMCTAG
jgi:hypothetical protein